MGVPALGGMPGPGGCLLLGGICSRMGCLVPGWRLVETSPGRLLLRAVRILLEFIVYGIVTGQRVIINDNGSMSK